MDILPLPPSPDGREENPLSPKEDSASPIPSALESITSSPGTPTSRPRSFEVKTESPRVRVVYDRIFGEPHSKGLSLDKLLSSEGGAPLSKVEFLELIFKIIDKAESHPEHARFLAKVVNHELFDALSETELLSVFLAASKKKTKASPGENNLQIFLRKMLGLPSFLGEREAKAKDFIDQLDQSDYNLLIKNIFKETPCSFSKAKKEFIASSPSFCTLSASELAEMFIDVIALSEDNFSIFYDEHKEALNALVEKIDHKLLTRAVQISASNSNQKFFKFLLKNLVPPHEFTQDIIRIIHPFSGSRTAFSKIVVDWIKDYVSHKKSDPQFLAKMAFHQTFNDLEGPEIERLKEFELWHSVYTYAYELMKVEEFAAKLPDKSLARQQIETIRSQLEDSLILAALCVPSKKPYASGPTHHEAFVDQALSKAFHLDIDESSLIPFSIFHPDGSSHSLSAQVTKKSDGTFRVLIFNFSYRDSKLYKPDPIKMTAYPIICDGLDLGELKDLIKGLSDGFGLDDLPSKSSLSFSEYITAYSERLGAFVAKDADPVTLGVRAVKGQGSLGICTHKSLSLWMHQNLPEALYRNFKVYTQQQTIEAFYQIIRDHASDEPTRSSMTAEELLTELMGGEELASKLWEVIKIAEAETTYTTHKILDPSGLSFRELFSIYKRNFWDLEITTVLLLFPEINTLDEKELSEVLLLCIKAKNLDALEKLRTHPKFIEAVGLIFKETWDFFVVVSNLKGKRLPAETLNYLILAFVYNKVAAQALLEKIVPYIESDNLSLLKEFAQTYEFDKGVEILQKRINELEKPPTSRTWLSWITGKAS